MAKATYSTHASAERRAYTVAEFIAAFRIGRTALYEQIAAGKLKTYKIGASRRISLQAAEEWQRGLEAEASQ
jgi:excisionase family DNA binding protein